MDIEFVETALDLLLKCFEDRVFHPYVIFPIHLSFAVQGGFAVFHLGPIKL